VKSLINPLARDQRCPGDLATFTLFVLFLVLLPPSCAPSPQVIGNIAILEPWQFLRVYSHRGDPHDLATFIR